MLGNQKHKYPEEEAGNCTHNKWHHDHRMVEIGLKHKKIKRETKPICKPPNKSGLSEELNRVVRISSIQIQIMMFPWPKQLTIIF